MNSGHVRMEKYRPVCKSHNRQRVSDQPFAVESPQDLPPGFLCHHKQRRGLDFEVFFAPDFLLQCNASLKLLDARAFSDDDLPSHHALRASIDFRESPFSARFAASHNSSICSRGTSASAAPLFAASSSIRRNFAENFAFAFFSAISGSTCRKRAKFTAAKSKSPISSSVFLPSFACSAWRSSPASSFILSITPSTFSQSNPIRAARRVSWNPSSAAGNALETPSSNEPDWP